MKGYLQRMVASASKPARALHPLVDGMFARDTQQGVMEESVVVRTSKAIEKNTRDVVAPESYVRERLVAGPHDLLVEIAAESISGESPQGMQGHTGRAVAELSANQLREEDAGAEIREALRPLQVRTLLVPEGVAREETQGAFVDAGESGRPVSRVPRNAVERTATVENVQREMQRGSEDIQIHIGRIEVIAVSPPVQRAAPVAARKTENLEEYLRRRDRRTR